MALLAPRCSLANFAAVLGTLGLAAGVSGQVPQNFGAEPAGKRLELQYANAAVRVKPSFVPLPAGAVVPKGWLRDWALDAAGGISGHLDEYSDTYGNAWKGFAFKAEGVKPDGTGWALEQCGYWLDGAVRLAYMLNDKALISKVSKRLDMVVAGVLNGGESFVYWRPNTVLRDTFNNWAHSHMGRALVAYYQATGDQRVLKALVKTYGGYPVADLNSGFDQVSGATNIDPMLDTYLMSGDRNVLNNITALAQRKTYRTTSQNWARGELQPGHGVIFYENIRVPALLHLLTSDRKDLAATLSAVQWHERYMLPVGISSAEEWQAGIGATRNIETCNVAASMWTYLWLLRITGDSGYSDRIERLFFNAAPTPVDREFKTVCYYQSPNRYSTSLPAAEPEHPTGASSYAFTNIGHRVLCCVGNLNRVIPNYVMHMWMATMDGGVAATLYGPSTTHLKVAGDVPVEIDSETSYPFEESVVITVRPQREVTFPLYLHMPSWCRNPEVLVNGRRVHPTGAGGAFRKVIRKWRAEDKVMLRLPMSPTVVKGRETPYPQISYFKDSRKIAQRTDINSPYGSVYYGPLLFSLPIPDVNPNQEAPGATYNYALDIASDTAAGNEIAVIRNPMPRKWTWSLAAPVKLIVKARQFDWQPTELEPLPKDVIRTGNPAKVVLVPYGCTKFRVSMFPMTAEAWGTGR